MLDDQKLPIFKIELECNIKQANILKHFIEFGIAILNIDSMDSTHRNVIKNAAFRIGEAINDYHQKQLEDNCQHELVQTSLNNLKRCSKCGFAKVTEPTKSKWSVKDPEYLHAPQVSKNLPYVNESTDEIPLSNEHVCTDPACGCNMELDTGNMCVMCEKFKLPHHFAPDHTNVCNGCWSKVKKK